MAQPAKPSKGYPGYAQVNFKIFLLHKDPEIIIHYLTELRTIYHVSFEHFTSFQVSQVSILGSRTLSTWIRNMFIC